MAIELFCVLIAHQGAVKRSLLLEPNGAELHVVVHVKATGDDRRRTLEALPPKQRQAFLVERGLDGLLLRVGTGTVALERVEVKTDGAEVMLHGVVPLSSAELRIETTGRAEPMDVVVLPGTHRVGRASRGLRKNGGLAVSMGPGDGVSVTLVPAPD
jgi:hypothetical protein